jgi:ubiquinone/menaquinone biosynthesis C-methylase UbiE
MGTAEPHYRRADLAARILEGLRAAGADPDALTPDDLAPVEHFRTRALGASRDLLRLAALRAGDRVLDLGGGIGGGARLLAAEAGCRVTVLDLTEDYVEVGRDLTRRTGLEDRVDFVHGDALSAPFADGVFDAVWTQHSSMNIPDKEALYAEARRVLRADGTLAIHEVMAGPGGPVHLPVPWARDPAHSHLRPAAEVRATIAALGFREVAWEDQSGVSLEFNRARAAASASADLPPLGAHLLLGEDYGAMVVNQVRNLEEDRIRIVMGVWRAGPGRRR